MTVSRQLLLLPERYAVVQLASTWPERPAREGFPALLAVLQTGEETTLICPEREVPQGAAAEVGWRALKVAGTLEFELTGVLAGLLVPLAQAGVSIFSLSTYSTDFILVKDDCLNKAVEALEKAGHQVIHEHLSP